MVEPPGHVGTPTAGVLVGSIENDSIAKMTMIVQNSNRIIDLPDPKYIWSTIRGG